MNPRLFDRLAAAASILILVGLGMLSYFLAQQAERLARPSVPRAVTHEPDYFVENLRLLKANAAGDPAVRVEAIHMRHYPDDRTIEFDEPHVVTLTDNRPAIRVTARTGLSPDTGEKADLIGNVRIVRDPTQDSPELIVLTSAATVLFEEKVVWSDAPVRIEMGGDVLTGIGMRLDSQTRQLQVDSRVRGLIAPRERTEGSGQPPASSR
ncbi:MAG: LPS export ABC transporter periplasmic protein LptC [Burkholderiaceae bacterium]|nr:LPS export ABC transporter periplasmic protein LptC [Burkholderiaceae bacterium]